MGDQFTKADVLVWSRLDCRNLSALQTGTVRGHFLADQQDPSGSRLFSDGSVSAPALPAAPPLERSAGQDGVRLRLCPRRSGRGGQHQQVEGRRQVRQQLNSPVDKEAIVVES